MKTNKEALIIVPICSGTTKKFNSRKACARYANKHPCLIQGSISGKYYLIREI